jgi:hypothetical protein
MNSAKFPMKNFVTANIFVVPSGKENKKLIPYRFLEFNNFYPIQRREECEGRRKRERELK